MTHPLMRLPVERPAAILGRLAVLRATAGEDAPRPDVTVWLHSGVSLHGTVVGCDPPGDAVLLQASSGRLDAVFVALSTVAAVTVHASEATLPLLRDVATPSPAGPPPTKLQLRRALSTLSQELSERLGHSIALEVRWTDFPTDEAALAVVWSTAKAIQGALSAVTADAMGRTACANLSEIQIRRTPPQGVHRDANRLLVGMVVGPTGIVAPIPTDALLAAIERVL
ncbi:MAG: hypothetical protein AAF721_27700 [Myxococcota bacterium]